MSCAENKFMVRLWPRKTSSFQILRQVYIATRWWQLIKDEITTGKYIERAFLKKYYSRDIQRRITHKLELERYRIRRILTRAEYFIDRLVILRHMTPKLTEDKIMTYHFEQIIQDLIRVQNVITVKDMENLLQREDVMEQTHKARYRIGFTNNDN